MLGQEIKASKVNMARASGWEGRGPSQRRLGSPCQEFDFASEGSWEHWEAFKQRNDLVGALK